VIGLVHLNPQLMDLIGKHGGYAVEVDQSGALEALLGRLHRDWVEDKMPRSALPPLGTRQAVDAILQRIAETWGTA
jgi:hypothetical protein